MTPEEFLQIINDLPDEDRKAYEQDLMMFGRGYVKMMPDGRYKRIDPNEVLVTDGQYPKQKHPAQP